MSDDIDLPPLPVEYAEHVLQYARVAVIADRKRRAQPAPELVAWVSVSERLPEKGVPVLVYSPPESGDWPDSVRIDFDCIGPDSDGNYWLNHGEHYEHYCMVAKGGDVSWTGPEEDAPYTHWMPLPPPPATQEQPQ